MGMPINKNISTTELKSRLKELNASNVGLSNNKNVYVELNNELYIVLHNGEKINLSQTTKETLTCYLVEKAINDEDIPLKLLSLATKNKTHNTKTKNDS